eukprot:2950058-Karenia_brevis.AAC.1
MASGRDVPNYIDMDVDAIIGDIFGHRNAPEDNAVDFHDTPAAEDDAVDIHDMPDSVWSLASVIHQRHVDIGGLELTLTDQGATEDRC